MHTACPANNPSNVSPERTSAFYLERRRCTGLEPLTYLSARKKLDKLTLGQLLSKCMNGLGCSEYRIFSVHAKPEMIDKRIASSILDLSMEFLFDGSLFETRALEQ